MSLFGKQAEPPSPIAPAHAPSPSVYGIRDLIRLLKTIPTDHQPALVLQVIMTTLESVGVQSSSVIEDALIREDGIREHAAMLEGQIAELSHQIEVRRDQIARLEVELVDTIDARACMSNGAPIRVLGIEFATPQA